MNLLDIAYTPAAEVPPTSTVETAVSITSPIKCGAVAVVEGGALQGIVTSRDVMLKVVLRHRNPETTLVREIMTTPVVTLHPHTEPTEALAMMLEKNLRHIPLSEDGVHVCGMLSLSKILKFIVDDQRDDLATLESFINADSIGG